MSLTLEEIIQQKERLQSEIAERECAVAVLDVLHAYAVKSQSPGSLELKILGSVLALPAPETLLLGSTTEQPTTAESLPPPPPPVKAYIHPELEAISYGFGSYGRIVAWAIQRMTADFTLRDILSLLANEGYPLPSNKTSVVLTRMKERGEIEELSRGRGRCASVFRGPASSSDEVDAAIGLSESEEAA